MSKKINIEQRMAEREQAFRLVFQIPFHEDQDAVEESIAEFIESTQEATEDLPEIPTGDFARALSQAVIEQLKDVDGLIRGYVKDGWSMERIPRVELAILRLAVAEFCYLGTPKEVVINEAVNLVKKYGEAENTAFVNGILHHFVTDRNDAKAEAAEGSVPDEALLETID